MNRLASLLLVFPALVLCPGCLHSKKNPKPKESAIAAETEASFRQRFVDKRAGELVAQGLAAETARTQALEEFKVRYVYTTAAGK
jgi:hypothetical protein